MPGRANILLILFFILLIPLCARAQNVIVSPSPVYMGQVPEASSSVRTVEIFNVSAQSLTIDGISVSGAQSGAFEIISGGAGSIIPLGELLFEIEFTPGTTGDFQATLEIQSSAGVITAPVSGAGTFVTLPVLTFERLLGSHDANRGSHAIRTSDGGYLVAGSVLNDEDEFLDLLLLKCDQYGTLVWNATFGEEEETDSGVDLFEAADGYIILGNSTSYGSGSSDAWLLKTDFNGNLQWSKTYGGSFADRATQLLPLPDGGFLVSGDSKENAGNGRDAMLIRLDAEGNEQWTKYYGGTGGETASSVTIAADGNYLFVGSTTSHNSEDFDIYIVKTDNSGNELWNKTVGGVNWDEASSVKSTTDGGFIISGYTLNQGAGAKDGYLVKTDADGNVQWDNAYGLDHADEFSDIVELPDGGFLAAGYAITIFTDNDQFSDLFIVRTDAQGNEMTRQFYGGDKDDHSSSMFIDSDGGIVLTGTSYSYSKSSDVYFMKVNSNGVVTGINDRHMANAVPVSFSLNQNFPNPFNGQTRITYQLPYAGNVQLDVFTAAGEWTQTIVNNHQEAGLYTRTFDADALTSGVYFYRLLFDGVHLTKKMILIK